MTTIINIYWNELVIDWITLVIVDTTEDMRSHTRYLKRLSLSSK